VITRKIRMLVLSVVPATVITFVGWVGSPGRYVAYIGALPGFDILAGILAMPGILFAVLLAAVFSLQGFHGAEQFIIFAPPVNWLGYFLLFFAISRRRAHRQVALHG